MPQTSRPDSGRRLPTYGDFYLRDIHFIVQPALYLLRRGNLKEELERFTEIVPGLLYGLALTSDVQLGTPSHIALALAFDNSGEPFCHNPRALQMWRRYSSGPKEILRLTNNVRANVWTERLRRDNIDTPPKNFIQQKNQLHEAVQRLHRGVELYKHIYVTRCCGLVSKDGAEERQAPRAKASDSHLGGSQARNRLLTGEGLIVNTHNLPPSQPPQGA